MNLGDMIGKLEVVATPADMRTYAAMLQLGSCATFRDIAKARGVSLNAAQTSIGRLVAAGMVQKESKLARTMRARPYKP